jgi:hypothetical protein
MGKGLFFSLLGFLLSVTAAYGASLTVDITPLGGGTVTADFVPIIPGVPQTFPNDSVVNLAAMPNAGFVFEQWEGGVTDPLYMWTTVVMDADKTLRAVFRPIYTLTCSVVPEGAGNVSRSPNRPWYIEGDGVDITAVPATGYGFLHWEGDIQGVPVTSNPVRITMTADKSLTAVLIPGAPTNPVPADGAPGVSVSATLRWQGTPLNANVLTNGGFETGDFTGWTQEAGPGAEPADWIVSNARTGSFGNGVPGEGAYYAQNSFDGAAGAFYELFQEVAINTGSLGVQLNTGSLSISLNWLERFQWNLASGGASQPREHEVTVQPSGGGTPLATLYSTTLVPETSGDTGYVSHSVDLIAAVPDIVGQTVRVSFREDVPETHTGLAQFDLDGVSLIGGGAYPTTYDVYLGTIRSALSPVRTNARMPVCGPGLLLPATTYYWQVLARNEFGQSSGPIWSFTTSAVGLLVFLESPRGGWFEEDQPLELHVTVAGATESLAYQWLKDGEALPGGTASEYSIAAVTPEDAGWYSCRVRDESTGIYSESSRALVLVFPPGSLPASNLIGLCIAGMVSVALGAMLIWRRRRLEQS